MRILMVSPHPTYSPRGTPISVLNRCRALSALGHQVDLVTYGIGQDVPVPGLRYLRAPVPGIKTVKVGPSPAKIPLDAAVFGRAGALLLRSRRSYDVLHTHEEAGFLGAASRRLTRLPHVYDMGNDLSVVMMNYGYAHDHVATRFASRLESSVVSRSDVVIAHFRSIADRVVDITGDRGRAVVIPNIALEPPADAGVTAHLRRTWSPDGAPIALYTGTLEGYQGLDAMVDAMATVRASVRPVRLVIVGGRPDQQQALRERAHRLGVGDDVLVPGGLQPALIPSALQAADVLVSPRAAGSNTPLKVFSYMASGKPILATRIESHTQVLDDSCAALVQPVSDGLASGLERLLADPDGAAQLGARSRMIADQSYGLSEYVHQVGNAYARVGGPELLPDDVAYAAEKLRRQLDTAGSSVGASVGVQLRAVGTR